MSYYLLCESKDRTDEYCDLVRDIIISCTK